MPNLTAHAYPWLQSSHSLLSGDLDGDCVADLIGVGERGSAFSVLAADKSGLEVSVQNPVTLGGSFPTTGAVADFDGDGLLDLAIVGSTLPSVLVRRGTPTGFGPPQVTALPNSAGAISAVDVNRDGVVDLIVLGSDYMLGVFLGRGDGSFLMLQAPAALTAGDSLGLAVADFDGDGALDVAAVSRIRATDHVGVFFGVGDGTFSAPTFLAALHPSSIASGDINGDGFVDVVYTNDDGGVVGRSDGFVRIALGDGRGGFTIAADVAAGTSPRAVTVRDMDLDGRPDLVVANTPSAGVAIILAGDAGLGPTLRFAGARYSRYDQIVVEDLNRDGRPDIGLPDGDQVVVLMSNSR